MVKHTISVASAELDRGPMISELVLFSRLRCSLSETQSILPKILVQLYMQEHAKLGENIELFQMQSLPLACLEPSTTSGVE